MRNPCGCQKLRIIKSATKENPSPFKNIGIRCFLKRGKLLLTFCGKLEGCRSVSGTPANHFQVMARTRPLSLTCLAPHCPRMHCRWCHKIIVAVALPDGTAMCLSIAMAALNGSDSKGEGSTLYSALWCLLYLSCCPPLLCFWISHKVNCIFFLLPVLTRSLIKPSGCT